MEDFFSSSLQSISTTTHGFETVSFEENPFFMSQKIHPLDFSGYCPWDFSMQENVLDAIPLMESLPTDPSLYASLDASLEIIPSENSTTNCQGDLYKRWEEEFGAFDETSICQFESADRQIVLYNNGDQMSSTNSGDEVWKDQKVSRSRERRIVNTTNSTELTRKTISRYFYMPITQAAKELNVGLTLLKKRCRELGIPRWPHRKLMSLQTLIKNVQEMEEGDAGDTKIRDAIELLEQQKKLMEEMPEVELEEKTKKLRQACFKANYKKRKLMGMIEWPSSLNSDLTLESMEASTSASTKRVRMQLHELKNIY